MGDFINNGSMTMDFQIQRAVDTSNVSDTPPPNPKKEIFSNERKGGNMEKSKFTRLGITEVTSNDCLTI